MTATSTCSSADFNPRPPHGERPPNRPTCSIRKNFNPRPPHGERPGAVFRGSDRTDIFNPRPPHGERHYTDGTFPTPPARGRGGFFFFFFFHAPRRIPCQTFTHTHFNPRPRTGSDPGLFSESTPPARGATAIMHNYCIIVAQKYIQLSQHDWYHTNMCEHLISFSCYFTLIMVRSPRLFYERYRFAL